MAEKGSAFKVTEELTCFVGGPWGGKTLRLGHYKHKKIDFRDPNPPRKKADKFDFVPGPPDMWPDTFGPLRYVRKRKVPKKDEHVLTYTMGTYRRNPDGKWHWEQHKMLGVAHARLDEETQKWIATNP